MASTREAPHSAHIARLGDDASRRVRNSEKFLAERSLSWPELTDLLESQYGDLIDLLLTSSAVHGLAGRNSDIDLIAISNRRDNRDRIQSHFFEGDTRIDVFEFGESEVRDAYRTLEDALALPLPDLLQRLGEWDARQPIRFRYLERLANGVSRTLELPYLDRVPDVARAWSLHAFDQFRKAIANAELAARAGEARAPYAYTYKASHFAMDAVMSAQGSVYYGQKWILHRWGEFDRGELAGGVVADAIDDLRAVGLEGVTKERAWAEEDRLRGAYDGLKAHLGLEIDEDGFAAVLQPLKIHLPFCGGTFFSADEAGNALITDEAFDPSAAFTLSDLFALPSGDAKQLLRASRAGFFDFSLKRSCLQVEASAHA